MIDMFPTDPVFTDPIRLVGVVKLVPAPAGAPQSVIGWAHFRCDGLAPFEALDVLLLPKDRVCVIVPGFVRSSSGRFVWLEEDARLAVGELVLGAAPVVKAVQERVRQRGGR